MGTNVDSFFFKPEHNNVTVDQIRELGFTAKKTSGGFIEAYPYIHIREAQKELDLKRELTTDERIELHRDSLVEFKSLLINGRKDGAPYLMHFKDDSCGEDTLYIYRDIDLKLKIENLPYSGAESKVADKINEIYGTKNFYTDIDFERYTESDLCTKEQVALKKQLTQQLEDILYADWLSVFEKLSEKQKLKKLFDASKICNSSRYLFDAEDKARQDIIFIERFFNSED